MKVKIASRIRSQANSMDEALKGKNNENNEKKKSKPERMERCNSSIQLKLTFDHFPVKIFEALNMMIIGAVLGIIFLSIIWSLPLLC